MADSQFNPLGLVTAPADWTLPASLNLLLKNVYASYDGTGAAGPFQPALQIVSDSGHTVGTYPCSTTVAAGGSADVTWFPGIGATSGTATTATPAASAYLYSQSGGSFGGPGNTTMRWEHFNTTNTSVFATNTLLNFNTPYSNSTLNRFLVCQQAGAYAAEATVVWGAPHTNVFAEIQNINFDYQDNGQATAIGALATDTSPVPAEGNLMTLSTKLYTIAAGDEPQGMSLLLSGADAATYNWLSASLVVHWLGSGIGADTAVY